MSGGLQEQRRIVTQALTGRGAHVLMSEVLADLDWTAAGERIEALPQSVFEITNHLIYWQDFSLSWIDGEKPHTPEHAAESWPGSPAPSGPEEWAGAVARFAAGLEQLEQRAQSLDLLEARGPKTVLEILQLIASHNSYHAGQIALIRRSLGAWPPPGGGATW